MTEDERDMKIAIGIHLRAATFLEAQIGTDSTPAEISEIKAIQKQHFDAIKLISPEEYKNYDKGI